MKIRKGDTVTVIAGKDRGKRGAVVRVLPKEDRIVVGDINMRVRHHKARRNGKAGERITEAAPLHASNVMLVCPHTGKPTRIGYRILSDGSKVRVSKKSGKEI